MDLNHEYYQFRFPDPQERKVFAKCDFSDVEIYEGELYIRLSDGTILKNDMSVIMSYLNATYKTAGEEEC